MKSFPRQISGEFVRDLGHAPERHPVPLDAVGILLVAASLALIQAKWVGCFLLVALAFYLVRRARGRAARVFQHVIEVRPRGASLPVEVVIREVLPRAILAAGGGEVRVRAGPSQGPRTVMARAVDFGGLQSVRSEPEPIRWLPALAAALGSGAVLLLA